MPGIYSKWYGPGGAHEQVNGYKGAIFKGFTTFDQADKFMNGNPPKWGKKKKKPKKHGKRSGWCSGNSYGPVRQPGPKKMIIECYGECDPPWVD